MFETLLTGCNSKANDAAKVQNNDQRFTCQTTVNDDAILLEFKEVSMQLPASWEDKYITKTDSDTFFTVYHKASQKKWKEEDGDESSGVLFTLAYCEDDSYEGIEDYEEVGESSDGGHYYLVFPSDVQAYVLDDKILNEYNSMSADFDYVSEHTKIK
jgi:hypothetical protein